MSCNWQCWLAKVKQFFKESLPQNIPIPKSSPTPATIVSSPIISTSVSSKPFIFPFSNVPGDYRPYLPVTISNINFLALVDSGSTNTVVSLATWNKIKHLQPTVSVQNFSSLVTTANGGHCNLFGVSRVSFCLNNVSKTLNTLIMPSLTSDVLLGVDFMSLFGISLDYTSRSFSLTPPSLSFVVGSISDKNSFSDSQKLELEDLILEFSSEDSSRLGATNMMEHVIDTGDAVPIKQRHYPASRPIQSFINSELDKMLQMDVVEPSSSAWSNPIVVVKKSSGDYRFCLDFRKLNELTKKDAYPLPYMSSILDKLGNSSVLSSLDLKSAFWQIPLSPESKEKTAFAVPGRGLFQFKRMPFGLSNAPASMQRLVDVIFGPELEPFVFVYLDDIVVVTPDFPTHLRILREVFLRLRHANLSLNFEKCNFARSELRYLGFLIDRNGLRVDPDKVAAVQNFPTPRNVKEVRRFVGLASWYRRFIPVFSQTIVPLTKLTKKHVKFHWDDDAQISFDSLKKISNFTSRFGLSGFHQTISNTV